MRPNWDQIPIPIGRLICLPESRLFSLDVIVYLVSDA